MIAFFEQLKSLTFNNERARELVLCDKNVCIILKYAVQIRFGVEMAKIGLM